MTNTVAHFLPDEASTLAFGATLATCCPAAAVIYLYGDLGAGKTTLARGFLRGLGYTGKVKSPTYTIVEPYEIAPLTLFHFDFYRLQNPQELEFIGVQDYFTETAIILAEWPERGGELLRTADLSCYIIGQSAGRELRLVAQTGLGQTILRDFLTKYVA